VRAQFERLVVGRGAELDERGVGLGQLHRPLRDHPEHGLGRTAGQQLGGDLAGRLQPPLAAHHLLEQVRVLHRDAGCRGQRLHHQLVVGGELVGATLLGQVQVAVHLVADPDGNAEEAAHRRMVGREADRHRVFAEVGQPQRLRVADQLPEQAPTLGQLAHVRPGLLVDADVDEPGQPVVVGGQHAQGAVPGVDQLDGRGHDPAQGGLQLEPGGDGQHRVEQALHAVAGVDDLVEAFPDLVEQLVEAQFGLHRMGGGGGFAGVCGLRAGCAPGLPHADSLASRRDMSKLSHLSRMGYRRPPIQTYGA
jgi:hypothetical protein